MNMSQAALPPRQPSITERDRAHPQFRAYQAYCSSMSTQLVEASAFSDWLHQQEQHAASDQAATDTRYPEFLAWMRQTKAGGRKCPAGAFPANFRYWLDGARW